MSNQTSADSSTSRMWGGRFSEATDGFVAEFTASVNFDQRFANQDIAGSIAPATMLAKAGIFTADIDRFVIIQFHGDTDGVVACIAHQRGRHGAVDTAAHSDQCFLIHSSSEKFLGLFCFIIV